MSEKSTIPVWDIAVRLFHWSLVALFIIAYLTGDEENDVHIYCGYAILALVIFRIIWGFVGTKYARFSDFVYPPREVFEYLRGLLTKNSKHYIGHNPAGGWMIIALLICLLSVSYSGLKVYAIEEGRGPLATDDSSYLISSAHSEEDDDDDKHERSEKHGQGKEKQEDFWEEFHEISANLTVLLILLHVLGVFISGKLHNENLVKGMITGRKNSD